MVAAFACLAAVFSALGNCATASAGTKVFGMHELNTVAQAPGYPSEDGLGSLLADLGARGHRWAIDWKTIEPRPPRNARHSYDFAATDRLYAADLAHGVRPLILAINAPKWAWGSEVPENSQPYGIPPGTAHLDDWAAFLAAAARRYPQALGFEIWNEPDAYGWTRGVLPIDPVAYTRVLSSAHKGVKSVDPCIPVIGGALATYSYTEPGVHMSVGAFLGGMLRAGAANSMDAVSMHDYAGRGPIAPDYTPYVAPVNWVRDVLKRNGVSMPIWISEAGISTTGTNAVSEPGQAQTLVSLYGWFQTQPDLEALFIHSLFERWTNPSSREVGFGLIHQPPSGPKPAFYALRDAARQSIPEAVAEELGLQVSVPRRQKVIRKGKLRVLARCLDCCSVRAKGRLKVRVRGGGVSRYRLRPDQTYLKPDSSTVLELRLRKKQRKKLRRRADRIRGRMRARVTVVARDVGGTIEQRKVTARLKVRHKHKHGH